MSAIAYLYSRYPVVSQTFCDQEMLGLEESGLKLEIASLNPPPSSFRHEHWQDLDAEIHYPAPPFMMKLWERSAREGGIWPQAMINDHEERYGPEFKPETRARNALYFARILQERGVRHLHVHFANRATHTALFIKAISGITFSFTAHAQDFMVDLGSEELLGELCREAEFVVTVSDYTKKLLQDQFPSMANKFVRIYNGLDPAEFPQASFKEKEPVQILSIGRLIEFKGFHHLIGACERLDHRGFDFQCQIVGEGPWHEELQAQIDQKKLGKKVHLLGEKTRGEVLELLEQSHLFVLPCIVDRRGASDILPTVILEAMASGLPVISSPVGGVVELVEEGETGFLVPPGDEELLTRRMERVMSDLEQAQKMGRQGRAKLEKTFDRRVTLPALREKFVECNQAPSAGVVELVPTTLYLVTSCPLSDPILLKEMRKVAFDDPEILTLVGGVDPSWEEVDFATLSQVEFLPDGIVLEAQWHYHDEQRRLLEQTRRELGGSVDGELYFREARRALYTAYLVSKRGLRHLHAARSESMLWAWLVGKLVPIRLSMTIEAAPVWSSALLRKMSGDFSFGNVAPPKLRSGLGVEFGDWLELSQPLRQSKGWKKHLGAATLFRDPDYETWKQKILS